MRVQVLVSTMNHQSGDSLIKEMGLKNSYVIINQMTNATIKPKDMLEKNRKFISFEEKGLSRSRNRAIRHATADICVIADDDMYYDSDYEETITRAYELHEDADIIAFRVANEDLSARSKEIKEGRVGLISSMKLSSVRLTFKKNSIIRNDIHFNEDFGAGAKYYAGEENIFLAECLKKGLKIYYVSKKIATLRINKNSSWFQGYNEYYFNVKGLTYSYISKYFAPLLILQFAIRKRSLYSQAVTPLDAIRYMFQGIRTNKPRRNIYFAGDFMSNTGPANVNKQYGNFLKDSIYICKSNSKIVRIVHFLSKVFFADKVVISGLSKFHFDILKISKFLRKEISYLMHGYSTVEYKINGVIGRDDRLKLEREILNKCTQIICVSERFADFLKLAEPDLKGKITFVNNGVDEPILEEQVQQTKHVDYRITSVGGGVPLKNNLEICEAIAKLDYKQLSFTVIGGKNKDSAEIMKYPFVRYYEKLSHDEVLKKMRETDLYVQNSTFETFGLAVCEALGVGCDLLVSKNVGAISVIENLTDVNIINSPHNTHEISHKIEQLIRCKTNGLVFRKSSDWKSASARLVKVIYGDRDAI